MAAKKFLYPAFLSLTGKACLVVGGGAVAAQKVRALVRAGARVTVVAPEIRPAVRRARGVTARRRPFRASDAAGPWALVVAATDDEALNARVYGLCEARGLWVNVVDRPALCSFILPAVARRGPLTFAVSTGGASPALAKHLQGRMRDLFGSEYAVLARVLQRWRGRLKAWPMARRKKFLAAWLTPALVAAVRRGGAPAAEASLRRSLAEAGLQL
jgi:siroheme synthase-like protein